MCCLEFDQDHNTQWGRLYEAQDVHIEWHGMLVRYNAIHTLTLVLSQYLPLMRSLSSSKSLIKLRPMRWTKLRACWVRQSGIIPLAMTSAGKLRRYRSWHLASKLFLPGTCTYASRSGADCLHCIKRALRMYQTRASTTSMRWRIFSVHT